MSKIYVATSFANIPEARDVMSLLREVGHDITWDWTSEALDPSWPKAQQDAYLQKCGAADYQGVVNADALVLINHDKARDAMTEFGVAIGLGRPVFVLYPERRSSVFFHRATALCATMDELEASLMHH
jgi:nucleoside 2-deoxyribosyltransferase